MTLHDEAAPPGTLSTPVYAAAFQDYLDAGYAGVLPLPPGAKMSPPSGYTGHDGADPTRDQVWDWAEALPHGNIAIRLPPGVLGLDVDAYDGKPGAQTYQEACAAWGTPPPTWTCTSRGRGASGIRLYRVPRGIEFAGQVGVAVETIQRGHRYIVAPPSVHPEGRVYQWLTPSGLVAPPGYVPDVSHFPLLPAAWVSGLAIAEHTPGRDLADGDASAWLRALPDDGSCPVVGRALAKRLRMLTAVGAGRHAEAINATAYLARLGADGHPGVAKALDVYQDAFLSVVTGDGTRTAAQALAEWHRLVTGAVALAPAQPELSDPCRMIDLPEAPGRPLSDPDAAPEPGEPERPTAFELRVRERLEHLRADAEARRRYRAEAAGPVTLDVATLAEILDRPEPPPDRIDGLLPADGTVLLNGPRKAGKTSLMVNLARCLIDGGDFLGRYSVQPVQGTVALLNFEMSDRQVGRWAHDVGVPGDRLVIVSLRGQVSPFTRPEVRADLAARLARAGATFLMVDTFTRAFTGVSENDTGEVGRFLSDLELFARSEVGVREIFLTAHTGWNAERTRGSSALEGWPDAIWNLRVDENPDNPGRYFSALGRDVDVPEDRLDGGHPGQRFMTLTGEGSRADAREAEAAETRSADVEPVVLAYVIAHPGQTGRAIAAGVRRRRADVAEALARLTRYGQVAAETKTGSSHGFTYSVITDSPEDARVADN